RRDEVVAVVVALVATEPERLSRLLARLGEQLRPELSLEELVGGALVDEELERKLTRRDERRRVVLRPLVRVRAEVPAEGLLPPGHLRRGHDRRERRDARVAVGLA